MIKLHGEDNREIVRLECEDWRIYRDHIPHFSNPELPHYNNPGFFYEDLEETRDWHLALLVDGEPVGIASVFVYKSGAVYLDQLFVSEAHRNKGYAKILHDARLKVAAENTDRQYADVDVRNDNEHAIRALISSGFQRYPEDQQTPTADHSRYYYDLSQRRNTPACPAPGIGT